MKNDRSYITSYRDITLFDLDGGDLQPFIRSAIHLAVCMFGDKAQYGAGLNGGATDTCLPSVTQVYALARVLRCFATLIFVDIVSAFGSILRRLSIPDMPEPQAHWLLHLASSGFTRDEAVAIVSSALSVVQWIDLLTATHLGRGSLSTASESPPNLLAGPWLARPKQTRHIRLLNCSYMPYMRQSA